MRNALIFATLLLATAGCWHHGVIVSGPAPVVVVEEERAWDGQVWIGFHGHHHGPGCGHFFHHSAWHVYRENYVYVRPNHAHFGVRIESSGPDRHSPPPDRPRHR